MHRERGQRDARYEWASGRGALRRLARRLRLRVLPNNSFEQLAINFANEKLQQFFLKVVFRAEEAEYASENVKYTPVEFQDNEGCTELIEKTPSGILRMLDKQCKAPKATDERTSARAM